MTDYGPGSDYQEPRDEMPNLRKKSQHRCRIHAKSWCMDHNLLSFTFNIKTLQYQQVNRCHTGLINSLHQ